MALRLTSTLLPSQTPVSSKGQTYTTAGTVYNPKSAQPLQPPARRGRSLKWTSGAFYSDLSLLPKSTLSSLALGLHGGARVHLPQQYSPLQQNYDRAVSPGPENRLKLTEPDLSQIPRQLPVEMTVEEASKLAVVAPDVDRESVDDETSDDEDDELGMKPLLNMGVKSLQNLASYSNPNQKRAQKALERSARSVQSSMAANPTTGAINGNASATGEAVPNLSPPFELSVKRPIMPAHASSFGGIEMRTKQEIAWKALPHDLNDLRQSYQSVNAGNLTSFSAGPGAPQPLTAGPPGQRQYRRSAFDNNIQALNGGDGVYQPDVRVHPQTLEDQALPSGLFAPVESTSAELDDLRNLVRGSTAFSTQLTTQEPHAFSAWESPAAKYDHRAPVSRLVAFDQHDGGAGSESNHGWLCSDPSNQYHGATRDIFQTRAEAREKLWRSGDRFIYDVDKCDGNKIPSFGAIGDRRPRSTKPVHEKLSIEEANSLPTMTHAKPLLQMALRTLESPGFRSQWSTPDASLIDSSSSSNRSLWGSSAKGKMVAGRKTTRKA